MESRGERILTVRDIHHRRKAGASWYPFSMTPCPLAVNPVAKVDRAAQQTGLLVTALVKLAPCDFNRWMFSRSQMPSIAASSHLAAN